MHNAGLPAVFGFGAGPDLKNSNVVIASAGQGGLSLPNRNYYTTRTRNRWKRGPSSSNT